MRTYIRTIGIIQKIALGLGIALLALLPPIFLLYPEYVRPNIPSLYDIAHMSVFFVMIVRPLADIFKSTMYIRPLVILRKGFGVLSASIIIAFILTKLIADPLGYLSAYGTLEYWSLTQGALLAHLADVTAVILLITSNNFSKRVMGAWWKRVQRLSYIYFYASSLYVFTQFGSIEVLGYILVVTIVTLTALIINRSKSIPQTV